MNTDKLFLKKSLKKKFKKSEFLCCLQSQWIFILF